ncbi:MAG: hypothetical protein D6791_07795 [Chloroflexi bacterium]|nr:MAG: hypothetical protein D6791_07795 [Chloroflexota bacterium]
MIALIILMAGAIFATRRVPAPLVNLYARAIGQPTLNVLAQPEVVTQGNTTITLKQAVASASHTVLEFTIENPAFPHDLEAMYNLSIFSPLSPGKDLRLTGFARQAVFSRRESRQPGALRLTLELPAPASFEQPVTIEIKWLKVLEAQDGQQGQIRTLEGPWRFTFVPQVPEAQRRERRIPVQQIQSSDGVHVTVNSVQISSTETVVTYRLQGPANEYVQMLGAPRLVYQSQTFDGRSKGDDEGDSRMTSFPALPLEARHFELNFGPFWVSQTSPVTVTLGVAELQAGGQTIQIGEHALHFQKLRLTSEGFQLAYVPAEAADPWFALAGPGAVVQVTDDLGQHYVSGGESLDFDPQRGMAVEKQTFRLTQPLNEEATQLNIYVDRTGRVVAPVNFQIATSP